MLLPTYGPVKYCRIPLTISYCPKASVILGFVEEVGKTGLEGEIGDTLFVGDDGDAEFVELIGKVGDFGLVWLVGDVGEVGEVGEFGELGAFLMIVNVPSELMTY